MAGRKGADRAFDVPSSRAGRAARRADSGTPSGGAAAPSPRLGGAAGEAASHGAAAGPGPAASFAACFAAGVLSTLMSLLFNGTLYLANDGVFDWSRDVATGVDILVLLALLAVSRRRPSAIRPLPFTAVAVAAGAAGYALCAAGVSLASAPAIVAGVSLAALADMWGLVLWLLATSALGTRRACLCLAVSGAVASPLGYALNAFAPYPLVVAVSASAAALMPLLCLPVTRPFFARLATIGAPRDLELAHPQAFLPFGHAFYVYIFVFSLAYGFALRCEDGAGPGASAALSMLGAAAVAAYAWRAHGSPRMDALFVASFLSVTVGFMLFLTGDARMARASAGLLIVGYICFQLLVWLALCSAAARNTADAVPAICWGTAVGYLGICAGVGVWLLPNQLLAPVLGGDGLLEDLLVVAVLAGLALYTLLTRRSFDFDAAVEGIAPDAPAPRVEVKYVDTLESSCDAAAGRYGLTAREADVMRLLAHGHSPSRIQEELGIGYNTVKFHVKNVYAKLGVHSQQELIDEVCAA